MNPLLVFILIAAVILVLGIIIWITSRRRRESALETMRARNMAASAPQSNTLAQVRALMAQDKKIDAISVLREATGMGLADAKAAVETLDPDRGLDSRVPSSSPPSRLPAELAPAVRSLLQHGDKIAAIKLVRERMNLDLKDAKDLVDEFE